MTDIHRERLYILALFLTVLTAALALFSSALSSSPPPEPPPPPEINISAQDNGRRAQLREGEALVISLEANPSTGYGWEVEQADLAAQGTPMLVQTGGGFLPLETAGGPISLEGTSLHPILGALMIQTLRFQAAEAGKTTLRLVYRRPWETDVPPSREFSLEVEAMGPFTGPPPVHLSVATSSSQPGPDLGAEAQLGLPSSFNWCTQGFCTPVKNQGGCGSCWAFSTVGVLESNILFKDGSERDLSEQYLLSCNTDGLDCGGGWFAHDYHEWKYPTGEPEAGAAYEVEFPYTARDDACNPPHDHYEKIADWAYVGNYHSVPSATSIKQAILDHGPVSVAIRVGDAFRSYTGDIFETNEVGAPNHAVILVGWDDDQGPNGIWYLRNSWGPGWGEAGYMRIAYGVSNVGYAANYVVYYPTCHNLDITVNPESTGTVVAEPPPNCQGGGGYEPGTVVRLTAEPITDWHFLSWGGDASSSDEQATVTMDSSKSIAAHFMCDLCTPQAHFPLVMND